MNDDELAYVLATTKHPRYLCLLICPSQQIMSSLELCAPVFISVLGGADF